jgi:hypothetical protein
MDLIIINLVLMPKKIGAECYYNFIFFLNYVLCKTGKTLWGEPLAFSLKNARDSLHGVLLGFPKLTQNMI